MSRGATEPPELPGLATQLMQGATNSQKDALQEVNSKVKRAITLDMLVLIENVIARRGDWSLYEKSLRFSVALLAWWGFFRLGELLSNRTKEFHASSSLLASDLKFHDGSISVWIRNPKIAKESTGDVVEVWSVAELPDLDPIMALKKFLQFRKDSLGDSPELPLFLHENGAIFTKQEMNCDLKDLLSVYPELNTSLDKWTGHCFRSGLPTLLAIMGYKAGCVHIP